MVKDKILAYVSEITSQFSFQQDFLIYSAEHIASAMKLKRNTVSGYLNQLAQESLLIKINSRPVYFLERKSLEFVLDFPIYEDSFDSLEKFLIFCRKKPQKPDVFFSLAGSEGSLRQIVNQIKIAVNYPPSGLPILIQGNTGVGKSYLAQLAYQYAIDQAVLKPSAPFLSFNCAQYADNAELLSSHLFGYMKGSFTGAISDRKGLLEEAEGGILFLDEVHRLSPEGQEKLFTFLDKGIFRRMGEASGWRTGHIRFIFASNQNAAEYMLPTLYRRIPITVKIPDLKDRLPGERLHLICQYLLRESQRLNQPVIISRNVLNDMTDFEYSGNIGELINVIQYICGNALVNSKDGQIRITRTCYPDTFLYQITWQESSSDSEPFLEIRPDMSIPEIINAAGPSPSPLPLFSLLLKQFKQIQGDISKKKFEESWNHTVNQYIDMLYMQESFLEPNLLTCFKPVLERIWKQLEFRMGFLSVPGAWYPAAMYLYQRRCGLTRFLTSDSSELYLLTRYIHENFAPEYNAAKFFCSLLELDLEMECTQEDILFFSAWFHTFQKKALLKPIRVLLLCRSPAISAGIANICNRSLGIPLFEPLIPLSQDSYTKTIRNFISQLEPQPSDFQLLFLLDDGNIADILSSVEESALSIGIITGINTGLALNIGKQLSAGDTLKNILSALPAECFPKSRLIQPRIPKRLLIITTCISGQGTAIKIQHMLEESFFDVPQLQIRAIDFLHLKDPGVIQKLKNDFQIIAIVGTDNPRIQEIPFVSIEKLIRGEGEGRLENLFGSSLSSEHSQRILNRLLANFSLENMVSSITIIDARLLIQDIEVLLTRLEQYLKTSFSNELKINLMIHISAMMERLVRSNPIPEYAGLDELKNQHPDFLFLFQRAFLLMEQKYGVNITDTEIGIIYGIIKNAFTAENGGIT